MNHKASFQLLLAFLIGGAVLNGSAQGTAFTYQGRLNDSGNPANATYDFQFAIYDASTNGNAINFPQTNFATVVSSGLFTATLDFGPIFSGTNYWLSIGVRTNGSASAFTVLWPRQALTPVPYAIFATSASNLLGTLPTTQLVGTLSSAQLAGTFSGAVNFTNSADSFSGRFFGNGLSLTNLNATMLVTGIVADVRLSTNVEFLNQSQTNGGANFFSGANTFASSNRFTGSNIFTGINLFTNASNVFYGNGTNLTSLNASQVTGGILADGRLSTNVALLNQSQTNGGANFFTGANNFTNRNNSFAGNFFGNGLVGWIAVSSTAINAVRDTGYLLLNAGLTTVTLPTSASLVAGDIVRISGAGGGGWLAQANSGQTIFGNFFSYRNGYLAALPTNTLPSSSDCNDIAVSADGTEMYAVGNFNGIYASYNAGQTWAQLGNLSGFWNSIACSANGKTIYIAPSSAGSIQVSTNGGVTWSAASGTGTSVACTADGSKFFTGNIACSGDGTYLAQRNNGISISINGGSSWFSITPPAANLSCLAVSSDCTRLVAGVSGGLLYASANLGTTWLPITSNNQPWSGAWMSADGSKFAATTSKNGSIDGGVFYSGIIPLPNTISTNPICGSAGSAVELQYIGNNQFMPVSSVGSVWAN